MDGHRREFPATFPSIPALVGMADNPEAAGQRLAVNGRRNAFSGLEERVRILPEIDGAPATGGIEPHCQPRDTTTEPRELLLHDVPAIRLKRSEPTSW